MKNLTARQASVIENCKAKGWYDTPVSFGTAMMLLTSEVAEAFEAWRKLGLEDQTHECIPYDAGGSCTSPHSQKPEGVGSEFADIVIRWLDYGDRFSIDIEAGYKDNRAIYGLYDEFPENLWSLVRQIARFSKVYNAAAQPDSWLPVVNREYAGILVLLEQLAGKYGIDLEKEVDRKMAYNKTRPYRHGGKRA